MWLPLWGFALGLAIISAASIAIPNGLWLARDYATVQVPRIAEHGEFGPTEWRLSADQAATLHKGRLPSGFTRKANSVYQASLFEFSANATLVRYIRALSANLGVAVPLGLISIFVFSVLFLITSRLGAPWVDLVKAGNEDTEWIFWQALLVITLLASPHTWVMNTIWLIPLCVVFFLSTIRLDSPRGSLILGLCGLGFVMLALPDAYWLEFSHPVIVLLSDGKYVAWRARNPGGTHSSAQSQRKGILGVEKSGRGHCITDLHNAIIPSPDLVFDLIGSVDTASRGHSRPWSLRQRR